MCALTGTIELNSMKFFNFIDIHKESSCGEMNSPAERKNIESICFDPAWSANK